MPKLGRKSPILLDSDYALYTPFGTENTPVLETKIVGGKLKIIRARDDPSIQPSKPIANLQAKDESQLRKVPKGRYDTTYRREYLNFGNGVPAQPNNTTDKYLISNKPNNNYNDNSAPQANNLNPFPVLPPINTTVGQPQQQQNQIPYQKSSIDHIIKDPKLNQINQNAAFFQQQNFQESRNSFNNNSNYLPIDPIYLNPQEEQNLINDVSRELVNYSSDQLKNFYSEMTNYDPNGSGFIHHMYVSLVAMRNNLQINESLMRFVMSRFVSPAHERDHVNYEDLVKFFAKCLGEINNKRFSSPPPLTQRQTITNNQPNILSPRSNQTEKYDPDEQAILRLMHENMREWDQVNLIDCDNLRRKFYEIDPYNRYILTQREIEDVVYKNRIPIQRSLIFQILEKYCKVASGQYRWPAFVDFLEKTYNLRLPNKKKTHYTLREDEKEHTSSQFTYRTAQLESLKNMASEEERLEEINKQIYNLQNLKAETKQRIESRLDNVVQGESWFTRFMRLANAMYNHRVNVGIEFVLPKEEARRLISAYNTVYELGIPESIIEDGLHKNTQKGNVIIDNLIKFLSKVK